MLNFLKRAKRFLYQKGTPNQTKLQMKAYRKRFEANSFDGLDCKTAQQYEACITKLYHSIEKGLSYGNYRPGFGKDTVYALTDLLKSYCAAAFDTSLFTYRTALCCLTEYIQKNKEHGYEDAVLNEKVAALSGTPNQAGGTVLVEKQTAQNVDSLPYEAFVHSRHSIRCFSDEEVPDEQILKAVSLAQHTPSACNRQGWKTVIIREKALQNKVLAQQNGNKGFGDGINKLLLIVADLRYFNRERELFQAYIDGGMYAQSVINGLHFEKLGTIPLSASMTIEQEKQVRKLLQLDEAEIPILFIGVGQYPHTCLTTKSTRREPSIRII